MKIALFFATAFVLSVAAFAEIDTYQECAAWLRNGYLHQTSYVPSDDGELFSDDCSVCGTFESSVESFCVNRPQWDFEGDNNMDCDLAVYVKINGSWQYFNSSTSYTNEESVYCGETCRGRYVKARVYDYQAANSGVVGVRFGKGYSN